jgi:hypothetical protein
MKKPIKNERKICDAVARILEDRAGKKRSGARCPEADHNGPPVDYRFDLSMQGYALEHTIVEAFPRQINMDVDYGAFIDPIHAALDKKLPSPGFYSLAFPIEPCAEIKRKELPDVQKQIIEWVQTAAKELHAEAPIVKDRHHMPHGKRGVRKAKLPGLPFEMTLTREIHWQTAGVGDGRLTAPRIAPSNVEDLRRERMRAVMQAKLPKLADCKSEGAKTVLILENRDIALTNHMTVCETVEQIWAERKDWPDEIFFVYADDPKEWSVWSLVRDGRSFPDEDNEKRYHEFKTNNLTAV